MSNRSLSLKQHVMRELSAVEVLPRKLLVAVSGGVDSVVLLHVLSQVKSRFDFEITVAHVHHGKSEDLELTRYRDKAQEFCQALAEKLKFSFKSNLPQKTELKSEADLREFRFSQLVAWRNEFGLEAIVLGHHFEDLLETQMMRLMRGSSKLGLGAMSLFSKSKRLRPLLNLKKKDLIDYAEANGLTWVDDPSNRSAGPLRNQVRQLLRGLEEARPGSMKNMALSFQRLVSLNQALERKWLQEVLTVRGIDRGAYLGLSEILKSQALVAYLRQIGIYRYTSGQLKELRKHLDQEKREYRFKYLGQYWDVSIDLICTTSIEQNT